MTKIDVISGFLGAGKTTLIKKLLKEVLADEQVVLIENEFGEIGIDGGFLKEAGIKLTLIPMEMKELLRAYNDRDIEIFGRLYQGDRSDDPKIADIMPYARRNDIFKDKYFKFI